MDRILLVQTAFVYHQVFVIADGTVELQFLNQQPRETLQFLMQVLSQIENLSLDRIVFVQGPGSFTSLRVGATWVNTLAYAKQLPIYNVSTLDYLALLLGKRAKDLAFTFDDKRFFLAAGESIVETTSKPEYELVHPDIQVLDLNPNFILHLPAALGVAAPMTDVLYIVPPKITLPKT